MKEAGAHAVKMEGGVEIAESVSRILTAGIPVMGHLGLTPQSIYKFGTYTVRAKHEAEAKKLKEDALKLQELGCFGIVLKKYPLNWQRSKRKPEHTNYRHRCRPALRWAGIGDPRYAGHKQRF
jgi:hypothetical protein